MKATRRDFIRRALRLAQHSELLVRGDWKFSIRTCNPNSDGTCEGDDGTIRPEVPIFEAPHGRATSPDLAIAVSNAGRNGALADLGTPEERARLLQELGGDEGTFFVNYILRVEPASLQAALDAERDRPVFLGNANQGDGFGNPRRRGEARNASHQRGECSPRA